MRDFLSLGCRSEPLATYLSNRTFDERSYGVISNTTPYPFPPS